MKAKLPGNLAHRAVENSSRRLASRSCLSKSAFSAGDWRSGGRYPLAFGFGQMQLAGVVRHRPVAVIVVINHLVKALEQLQFAAHAAGCVVVDGALRSSNVNTACASNTGMLAPRQLIKGRGRLALISRQ